MRFILIILMTATMLSCKDDMEHRLKGGMVITVKGDTIKFYGGTFTYKLFGERDIRGVVIDESKEKHLQFAGAFLCVKFTFFEFI